MSEEAERAFQLGAFMGFLRYASKNLTKQFKAETGLVFSAASSPIDLMIDRATGHDRFVAKQFIEWAARQYGLDYLPTDYLDQIMKPEEPRP